jgi:hypothetical protein
MTTVWTEAGIPSPAARNAESDMSEDEASPGSEANVTDSSSWRKGERYTVSTNLDHSFSWPTRMCQHGRNIELGHYGYGPTLADVREISQACDAVPGEYLGEGIFIHRDVMLKGSRPATVYRLIGAGDKVRDIGILPPANGGIADDGAEIAILARMRQPIPSLFPLAGNKSYLTESEPSHAVPLALLAALKAKEVTCFVDAFAGTGYFTLWVATQRRRKEVNSGLRQILNEWDCYRHNTLKTAQQHPAEIKAALQWHEEQIQKVFYRAFHNLPPSSLNGAHTKQRDKELADWIAERQYGEQAATIEPHAKLELMQDKVSAWVASAGIDKAMNKKLGTALKDYILDNIDCPLPDEGASDVALRVKNAALYLLTQHNQRIESTPVNFHPILQPSKRTHASGLSTGSGGVQNRMLAGFERACRKGGTGQLRFGEADEDGKERRLARLPSEIDRVSDALTEVEIRRGDGWALLNELDGGVVAAIDPPYWEPNASCRPLRYTQQATEESTIEGFFKKLDEFAMPVWMKHKVRLMVFNRMSGQLINEFRARGFEVYVMQPRNRADGTGWGEMREVMAVNFRINEHATLHDYVAAPDPERRLLAPDEIPLKRDMAPVKACISDSYAGETGIGVYMELTHSSLSESRITQDERKAEVLKGILHDFQNQIRDNFYDQIPGEISFHYGHKAGEWFYVRLSMPQDHLYQGIPVAASGLTVEESMWNGKKVEKHLYIRISFNALSNDQFDRSLS